MNKSQNGENQLENCNDQDDGHSQAPWQLTEAQLEKKLQTNLTTGLKKESIQQRLLRDGLNELVPVKESWLHRLLKQFNNIISYVLMVTAGISLVLHHYPDAAVIGIVIIANALIGYFQEVSAAKALAKLQALLVKRAYVIRNSHKLVIAAKNLVVGDLVALEAGEQVPADLRLLAADSLLIQESILTGEAQSAIKTEDPLPAGKIPLAERSNLAFAGTSVTHGSGVGVVIATGQRTELGQIQQEVAAAKPKLTPLMRNLNRLGWQLSVAIVVVAVIMFAIGAWMKIYSLPVLLIAVVTMVVGSMPEGMPASVSVVLAMGTRQLAKKSAIVKSLPAVETLGAVDIVNSDKTGTLTKNEMLVTDIITREGDFQIEDGGYGQQAKLFTAAGQPAVWQKFPMIKKLLKIAGQTTDAVFNLKDKKWQLVGEPTDGALAALYQSVTQQKPRVVEVDSLPFDSAIRYSARLADDQGKRVLFVKGAPQTLIKMIQKYQPSFETKFWQEKIQFLTRQGKRVVALAYQTSGSKVEQIEQVSLGQGMQLIGLTGIIDPARPEVAASIAHLQAAGVKVKMITGDDPRTAAKIAEKIGLEMPERVITGPQMDEQTDEQLAQKVDQFTIFARTTPKDKLRIVKAQQQNDHVVAMTGDGVNDAPALKQADIGVAMGIKGTDVAKGAADMVLANDDFSTIETSVQEGHHVFDNIRKSIRFLLPTSFAEGLIVVLSILLNQKLPLYPTQLLWINMVSALTIQFAFIFEPIEKGIMQRGPRKIEAGILTKGDMLEIAYVALLIAGLGIGAYDWAVHAGLPALIGSTMTLNIIIFGKIFYLFDIRTNHYAISKYFFQNKMAFWIIGALLLLQVFIIYTPFMQDIFYTTSVDLFWGWIVPVCLGAVVLLVTEVIKFLKIRLLQRPQ
jgi:magnesium-transporting ATPase (P-type)